MNKNTLLGRFCLYVRKDVWNLLFRLFCPPTHEKALYTHAKQSFAMPFRVKDHRVTLSDFRVPFRDEYYLSPTHWLGIAASPRRPSRMAGGDHANAVWRDRHDTPFENIGSNLDMFHEQLPLPVPCYDLLLVTEFAVVPARGRASGTPSSLELTGGEYKT